MKDFRVSYDGTPVDIVKAENTVDALRRATSELSAEPTSEPRVPLSRREKSIIYILHLCNMAANSPSKRKYCFRELNDYAEQQRKDDSGFDDFLTAFAKFFRGLPDDLPDFYEKYRKAKNE